MAGQENPFDRFDAAPAAPANPFDRFDPAPARPIAAAVATPAPIPLTGSERFWGNANEAFDNTLTGVAVNAVDVANKRAQARALREQGFTDAAGKIEAGIGAPSAAERKFQQGDAWNADGLPWYEKLIRGVEAGGGQTVGALTSPETYLGGAGGKIAGLFTSGAEKVAPKLAAPIARAVTAAAPVAGRVGEAAVVQGGVQAGVNLAGQGERIATGQQKAFDPMATVEQAVFGAALGGGLHAAGEMKGALQNAFADWRIKRWEAAQAGQAPPAPLYGPPTRGEAAAFAASEEAAALRQQAAGKVPAPQAANVVDMRGRPIVPPMGNALVEPTPAGPAIPEPVQVEAPPIETAPNPKGWETNPNSAGPIIGGDPVPEAPPVQTDLRGRPIETAPAPVLDEHATKQAAIDDAVKQEQANGTPLNGYDHTPEAAAGPEGSQSKVASPVEEGTAQSGGDDGGAKRSGDSAGSQSEPSGVGGATSSIEPGGGTGVGGNGETVDGGGQPGQPGSAKSASGTGPDGARPEPENLTAPKKDLVVARKMPDGTVRYGEPGQIHADLLDEGETYWKKEYDQGGFATAKGEPFMSRKEAIAWVEKNQPEKFEKLPKTLKDGNGLEADGYRREGARPTEDEPAPAPEPAKKAAPAKAAKAAKAPEPVTSTKAAPMDKATKRFATDEDGHVKSDNGGKLKFGTKGQVEKWLDNVGSKAVDGKNKAQNFKMVPDKTGGGYHVLDVDAKKSSMAPTLEGAGGKKDAKPGAVKTSPVEPPPAKPSEKKTAATKPEPKKAEPKAEAKTKAKAKPEEKAQTHQPTTKFKHEKTKAGKQHNLASDFAAFHKHGNYTPTVKGTAKAIADYLISRGKQSGHEALIFHDPINNRILGTETSGKVRRVSGNNRSIWERRDPANQITMHHNHPRESSLSKDDLIGLALAGMKWVVAHSPAGEIHAAKLGKAQRALVAGLKTTEEIIAAQERITSLFGKTFKAANDFIDEKYAAGLMSHADANLYWAHMSNMALDRAGHIDYVYSKEIPAHVQELVDEFGKQHVPKDTRSADYRRAQQLRADEGLDRVSGGKSEPAGTGAKGGSGKGKDGAGDAERSGGEHPSEVAQAHTDALDAAEQEHLSDKLKDDPGKPPEEKIAAQREIKDQFYSSDAADPKPWKGLLHTLTDVYGWAKNEAGDWVDAWKENFRKFDLTPPEGDNVFTKAWDLTRPARKAAEIVFKDIDGVLRSAATARNSPTLRRVADMFHAATEGIADRVTGVKKEDYFAAKYRNENHFKNRYGKAVQFVEHLRGAERMQALEQIGKLVQHPQNIKRGTPIGDAAHEITKIFKDMHGYLRDAGIDVGTVRDGYLPRIENVLEILKDPEGFKAKATQAYIVSGYTKEAAEKAAKDWHHRILMNDYGVTPEGVPFNGHPATPSNFTKSRTLTKAADEIMGKFYHQNVADIVPRYIDQAIGRAEWARRFGRRDPSAVPPKHLESEKEIEEWRNDSAGKWKDVVADLIAEGNGDLVGTLVGNVRAMTGDWGAPGGTYGQGRSATVFLRTANIIGKLSYSVLSSLSEPITHAVQTGDVRDAARAYFGLIHHWAPILRKMGDGQYISDLADALDITGETVDRTSAMMTTGGESGSHLADTAVSNFMRQTGQTQFTEASRKMSVGMGLQFFARLAKHVERGDAFAGSSKKILMDFGISDPEGFAKYHAGLDKPTGGELYAGGKHGADYALALQRYVQRTVMHPTGALKPYYANNPTASIFFALQAFNYTFKKQVLDRVVLQAKDAANFKNDLTPQERLWALTPMMNLGVMAMVSYGIGSLRDEVLPDPMQADKDPMSEPLKWTRAVSRIGGFGYMDPLVNLVSQSRYKTDAATAALGPAIGPGLAAVGSGIDYVRGALDDDAPDSNTAKRRAMTSAWDIIARPALQSVLAFGPPATTPAKQIIPTALTYLLADRRTRAAAVDASAGEAE